MLCVLLAFGCSGNRFKNYGMINDFTFFTYGLLGGHDDFKFCNKIDPKFIDPYPNGINPSRICIRYQYYTCHIIHYCPNLPTEPERKKCEYDAAQYWTPLWDNAHGDLEKRVSITKKVCDTEEKNCNSGLKNDVRCRNLPTKEYQEIIAKEQHRNSVPKK